MKFTDEEIKAAIKGSSGIRKRVLAALNEGKPAEEQITRQSLQERIAGNPELLQLETDERANLDDTGEDAFEEALSKKEIWAIKSWLKYRGRERGFVERQEHTGKDGKDLPTTKQQVVYVPIGDYAKVMQQEANEKADQDYPVEPE
ncbi:MAG: hypothetical protein ACP5NS_04860 [Candidatus Pacearchaeota archaeon]